MSFASLPQRGPKRSRRLLAIEMLEAREFLHADTVVNDDAALDASIPRTVLRYMPNDPYYQNALVGRQQWTFGPRQVPTGFRGANIEAAWDFLIDNEGRRANPTFTARTLNLARDRDRFAFGRDIGVNGTTPIIAIVDNGVQIPTARDFAPHPDLPLQATLPQGFLEIDSGDCTIQPPLIFPDGGPGPPPGLGTREFYLNAHGTAVAGIVVADRDDSEGISGVAPDVFWSSKRVLPTIDLGDPAGSGRSPDIVEGNCNFTFIPFPGLAQAQTGFTDIFVNAWGPVDGTDWRTDASVPGTRLQGALTAGVNGGRRGLGNIFLWAAGNGRELNDNVNYDRYASNRFTIAVGAVDQAGAQTAYSEEGASVFVVAPSSRSFDGGAPDVLTTDIIFPETCDVFDPDLVDAGGYNYNKGARDPRNDVIGCREFLPDQDPFQDFAYASYGNWSAFDAQGAFGGTSAATPLIAGIIALMLDARDDGIKCIADNTARPDREIRQICNMTMLPLDRPIIRNPNQLTYRDVQHILTRSTYRTGGQSGWARNDAPFGISPDGDPGSPLSLGAHVSHKFGFGAIDAETAVRWAYEWPGSTPQFFLNSDLLEVPRNPADPPGATGRRIPDNTGQAVGQIFRVEPGQTWIRCGAQQWETCTGANQSFPIAAPPIEWVEVELTTEHQFGGDLEVTLVGPGGTRSELAKVHGQGENYNEWTFVTNHHWGESPVGDWSLQIRDAVTGNTGSWISWEIRFFSGMDFTVDGAAPPVAVPDAIAAPTGTSTIVRVLDNDTGAFLRNSVILQGLQPNGNIILPNSNPPQVIGRATVDNQGRVQVIGLNGYQGPATIGYQIFNRFGFASNTALIAITFQAPIPNPPDPPIAVNDTFTTLVGTPISMNVLFNDDDPDPGVQIVPASVTIVTPPPAAAGTATVNVANGQITFTPAATFIGTTTLTYQVSDITALVSNIATVTITVLGTNVTLPDANNDSAATLLDAPVLINVLTNDIGSQSPLDPTGVQIVTAPDAARGTATVDAATGVITFTPAAGVFGSTTFTYRVRDARGFFSDPATVTALVRVGPNAVNDAGVLFTTQEGASFSFDPLANDVDFDGSINRATLAIVTPPVHGTLTIHPTTGIVMYSPECDYSGEDMFTYTIRDNDGLLSNVAQTKIVLVADQDPPTSVDDVARTNVGAPVILNIMTDILGNDRVGDDGDSLSPSTFAVPVGGQPQHGSLAVNLATGQVTYTPDPGFVGGDSFTYFVRDTDGITSNPGMVRIRVGAPVTLAGSVYLDTNNNGLRDAGELPVTEAEIAVTVVSGAFSHTQKVRTDATGAYSLVDSPGSGLILPAGSYTIAQTQPALLVDGIDAVGNVAATASNDRFANIALSAGQAASGYNFGERQFRSDFAINHPFLTRLYVASASLSATDTNPFGASTPLALDLSQGSVWLSLDKGLAGHQRLQATSFDGAVKLEVYSNTNFTTPIASSGNPAASATLEFDGTSTPQFLRITGTGSNFTLNVIAAPVCMSTSTPFPATLSVASSQWAGPFKSQIATLGLGDNGYVIPGGTIDQLKPAPWSNVNQIVVRFGQPVTAGLSSIAVRGVNVPSYAVNNFNYDSATNVATWTLATPIVNDKVIVDLSPIGESFDLDGIGTTEKQFRFNVLAGDVTQNGKTSLQDMIPVRNAVGSAIGGAGYTIFRDLNGSGAVDGADLLQSRLNQFSRLPVGEPTPPVPAPSPEAPAALIDEALATSGATSSTLSPTRGATATAILARRAAAPLASAVVDQAHHGSDPSRPTILRARRTPRPGAASADSLFTRLGQ